MLYLHVCKCAWKLWRPEEGWRALRPWNHQTVVRFPCGHWELDRTTYTLNFWAIAPSPRIFFFNPIVFLNQPCFHYNIVSGNLEKFCLYVESLKLFIFSAYLGVSRILRIEGKF